MGPIAAVAPADERRILYEIIRTISSSVDLEEVLAAIVRLVSEGTKAHGAYVFIVEGDGRLVLRAATGEYRDQIGRANMRRGEGIAGWVAEHRQPVFIPEDALSDPRIKYFPELDEDKYQSLVSVPLIGKAGDAIGVIALHAEAPRVFTAEDASFVIHSASLVASAIENARLYEEARRRVRELERLSTLAEAISSTSTVEELLPIVTAQSLALLRAEQVHVYLVEGGDALRRASSAPVAGDAPPLVRMAELSGDLRRRARRREHARRARGRALGRRDGRRDPDGAARGGRRAARLPRRTERGRAPVRRRRPRPRRLRRRADGRRHQEDPADRGPRRAQPDQGLLPGARRRPQRPGRALARAAARLRPRAAEARGRRDGLARRRAAAGQHARARPRPLRERRGARAPGRPLRPPRRRHARPRAGARRRRPRVPAPPRHRARGGRPAAAARRRRLEPVRRPRGDLDGPRRGGPGRRARRP